MLDLLTGENAGHLLTTALTGRQGQQVPGFRYEVERVHARPGAETSVGYQIWYRNGADEVSDHLVATTANVETGARVVINDQPINFWRHPADPRLPGLAASSDPTILGQWLEAPVDAVELKVYRPLRRAVLKIGAGQGCARRTWFAKVVRPKSLDMILRRQRLFVEAGIGAPIAHVEADGVMVQEQAAGLPLAELLSSHQRGQTSSSPDAIDMLDALDRLPTGLLDMPVRPSWTARTDFHAQLASQALPGASDEIERLAARISALADSFPVGDVVPTHGDCYEANVFWDDEKPTFIDLDTAGPGHRVDDLACMLAHLAVLPQLSAFHYPLGHQVVAEWHAEFAKRVHPGALAIRTAGVLLSLVSGGSTDAAWHRLDLVRSWISRAQDC